MSPTNASKAAARSKALFRGVTPYRPKKKVPLGAPTTGGTGAGNDPNLLYRGGPIVNKPVAHLVFVGDWTSTANQNRATRLQQFVTDLFNSSYMNILSQYGCGSTGTVAASTFLPNTTTPLTHNDLTTLLQNAINSNNPATHLPEPGPSDIYVMFLDDNTDVDDASTPNPVVMCEATSDTAFGYHDLFTTTANNPMYFAVIPGLTDTCLQNSCPVDANCTLHLAQTQEQRQTAVASHEISEMITNPQNSGIAATSNFAWSDPVDGFFEIGDICAGQFGTITVGSNTWTVQLMYSKIDDMQSNGATTCVASEPDPLPSLLPAVTLILDRSTFGADEVNAALPNVTFKDAIYVVVDGYTADELGLGATNLANPPNLPTFTGTFAGLGDPSINFDSATGAQLDQPGKFWNIQRITFPFNIEFKTANAFAGLSATNPTKLYSLASTITNTVTSPGYPTLTASSATAELELVFQADPYLSAGETWWLSNDMRVFKVTPATLPANKIPLQYSSTPYTSDPNTYIKALINELNTNFTDPTVPNTPFSGISPDEEQSALSLTANDTSGNPVFNFALARAHLTGDTANNVRLFFRLFISSSPDTTFDTTTTYRSGTETDASGNPISGTLIPLLGFRTTDMSSTIPFFAEPRVDATSASMTRQTDPANVQTIPSPLISPPPPAGAAVCAYFGCWLDINQPTPRFPLDPSAQPKPDGPYSASAVVSIPGLIMSTHACLLAQIAYDPDPIPAGAGPSTSDKLNQRNLAWSSSDNPGPADGHRAPTLFDLRLTAPSYASAQVPDELMIEWGDVPPGSLATVYLPQLYADDLLALAVRLYPSQSWRKYDAHSIQLVTSSVSYIPIPLGTGASLAGLITIDLPPTVRMGQEFNVVLRRLSWRGPGRVIGGPKDEIGWRYVVGAFQIRIPVGTGPELLGEEESLLALFKWKLEILPPANRWVPVLQRYVEQISGRVNGFGGNAGGVPPSQGGYSGGRGSPGDKCGDGRFEEGWCEAIGKVSLVLYDRFGDFVGFVIADERGCEHRYRSREAEVERVIRLAWSERASVGIRSHPCDPDCPTSIVLRSSSRHVRD
jgi:hypothetical protein